MKYYVAPSFEGKDFLCDPYEKDGKMFVKIAKADGSPREIRVYDKPQASWGKSKKAQGNEPRVERYNDKFLAFNIPGREYAYIVGMEDRGDGTLGFWHYRKKPDIVKTSDNIVLSVLFGYICRGDKEPIWELDPEFITEEEVRVENGYRRLIDDKWLKEEYNRLWQLYDGLPGPYNV